MRNRAAPQTAGGTGAAELEFAGRALEALRLAWGDTYLFGYEDGQYWAPRPQAGSGWLRAGTPEELGAKLAADFETGATV